MPIPYIFIYLITAVIRYIHIQARPLVQGPLRAPVLGDGLVCTPYNRGYEVYRYISYTAVISRAVRKSFPETETIPFPESFPFPFPNFWKRKLRFVSVSFPFPVAAFPFPQKETKRNGQLKSHVQEAAFMTRRNVTHCGNISI